MAVDWSSIGKRLAVAPAARQDAYESRLGELAGLDLKLQKSQGRRDIDTQLADAGYVPEEAALLGALIRSEGGSNFNAGEMGLGRRQERTLRDQAVQAYGTGGAPAANQYRAGLGNSMIDATKITQGQAYNPTVAPNQQDIVITDIGDSVIGANNARGEAALIRANKPPAARASGGSKAGEPKLSERDKVRRKRELAPLATQIEDRLDTIAEGGPHAVRAQNELAELQAQEDAIYAKYEGGLGDAVAGDTTTVADASGPTYYNDPETGEQRRADAVSHPAVPPAAVKALWADLTLRDQFTAKYGKAATDAVLAKRPK